MYNIFKKHILRSERHLLPIINKAKRIRVDDKYIEIDYDKSEGDSLQLPYEVTCFEFKRYIILSIDQFRNQKGYWENRKIILFTKMGISRISDTNLIKEHFIYEETVDEEKQKISALSGDNIFSYLMCLTEGGKDEKDLFEKKMTSSQLDNIVDFCMSKNIYLKWEIETNINDPIIILDDVFYLISKKESLKINLPKYSNDYICDYLNRIGFRLMVDIYKSVVYLKGCGDGKQ